MGWEAGPQGSLLALWAPCLESVCLSDSTERECAWLQTKNIILNPGRWDGLTSGCSVLKESGIFSSCWDNDYLGTLLPSDVGPEFLEL